MRLHIDVLGWLHVVWGAFGVLTGAALMLLAAGTAVTLSDVGEFDPTGRAAIGLLLICGAPLAIGGAVFVLVGRSLLRRHVRGRLTALLLAVPDMVLVPFGTGLGIYTFWVLLNDDARREFGRPPRSPLRGPTPEGA